MIEIVADDRRLAERRAMKVIIPCVHHAFFGGIRPDLLIQRLPVVTALLCIDLSVQFDRRRRQCQVGIVFRTASRELFKGVRQRGGNGATV